MEAAMYLESNTTNETRSKQLQQAAERLRWHSLEVTSKAGSGHPTSCLSCDVKNSTKLEPFFQQHPERSIECYIAEQNMVGMATGLSKSGMLRTLSGSLVLYPSDGTSTHAALRRTGGTAGAPRNLTDENRQRRRSAGRLMRNRLPSKMNQ